MNYSLIIVILLRINETPRPVFVQDEAYLWIQHVATWHKPLDLLIKLLVGLMFISEKKIWLVNIFKIWSYHKQNLRWAYLGVPSNFWKAWQFGSVQCETMKYGRLMTVKFVWKWHQCVTPKFLTVWLKSNVDIGTPVFAIKEILCQGLLTTMLCI